MNSNQTILCPVVNSSYISNELHYAAQLAKARNKKVILLAVLNYPMVPPYTDAMVLANKMQAIKEKHEQSLAALSNQLKDTYQIEVLYDTEFGLLIEEVIQVALDYNVGTICMSWSESTDHKNSVSTYVQEIALKTCSPLLLVPPNARFKELNQLVRWYDSSQINYGLKFPFWLLNPNEEVLENNYSNQLGGVDQVMQAKDNFYSIKWETQIIDQFLMEKGSSSEDYIIQLHQEDNELLETILNPTAMPNILSKINVPIFIQPSTGI